MLALIAALLLSPPSAAEVPCSLVAQKENVELKKCGNLSILRLKGHPAARAYEMGTLLRGPLSPELVNYFSYKIFESRGELPFFLRPIFPLLYNQVVRLFHRAAPVHMNEEIDALAAGMGVDSIHLRRAITLPDAGAALNALSPVPAGGCTSAATQKEGSFVYGRNLDFAGVELWDKHPLLILTEPEAGSAELRHAAFASDGALFAGITGVNEAGITFAVHQVYSRDSGLFGVPMMLIGEIVLRRARSLKEAEDILRAHRPAVLWTFVLTDLNTGEAITVETSQKNFSVRSMQNGSLVQTNHVMGPEVRSFEQIPVGTKYNSEWRMKTVGGMLDGASPTAAAMAHHLSFQKNVAGEMEAYGDVLKAHTIQTVIFESSRGRKTIYVSQDPAPTASGTYLAFDFDRLFGREFPVPAYVDFLKTPAEKRKRQREISLAFHAYFDQMDIPRALSFLTEHRTLDAALFRATANYQGGYYGEAILIAKAALADPRFRGEPDYIFQSLKAVEIASLVKSGKTAEARNLAEALSAEKPRNVFVARLSDRVARGLAVEGKELRLAFEFFSGDIGARPN